MLGLTFAFTLITNKNFKTFLAFLLIWDGYVVWAGLLELWTLVLFFIVNIIIIYLAYKQRSTQL